MKSLTPSSTQKTPPSPTQSPHSTTSTPKGAQVVTREIPIRDALREAMSEEMRHDERVLLMGEEVGAEVWLEKAPLKYDGLTYTEIWISEAQERMVLSVPQESWDELRQLCESEGVEAAVLGRFAPTGRLLLTSLLPLLHPICFMRRSCTVL